MEAKVYNLKVMLTNAEHNLVKFWDQTNRKKANETAKSDPSTKQVLSIIKKNIRRECFLPYPAWQPPTKEEIALLVKYTKMTQKEAANYVGMKDTNGRNFRRFIGGQTQISYAYWIMLCQYVNIPRFW